MRPEGSASPTRGFCRPFVMTGAFHCRHTATPIGALASVVGLDAALSVGVAGGTCFQPLRHGLTVDACRGMSSMVAALAVSVMLSRKGAALYTSSVVTAYGGHRQLSPVSTSGQVHTQANLNAIYGCHRQLARLEGGFEASRQEAPI